MQNRTSRIIKNTGFLYARMMVTIIVSLYTSRVLLETLGAADFGLYHVVAGFVVLAGFLQGALSGTTQRFIAFELGKKEERNVQKIFSMSVNIHLIFALIILIIGGAIGTWLLPTVLMFDEARTTAVVIVFWFALLSFVVNISIVPCHAMIVAHEEMKVFSWVSIADAFLKLAIVFLIQIMPYDPLVAYSILIFMVTTSIAVVFISYVYLKYKFKRYKWQWDQSQFKELVSFSGWTIWGNAASVFANQGTNILLNIFFGPIVNAAKSIGNQASGALNQFVSNLQLAINPQIIKSYSAKDYSYTTKLLCYGSKYNFFLIFMLALPILIRADDVLKIWLVEPPPYSATFLKLILINIIIESISRPLITAAQATGNIKLYQFVVGGILLLNIPLSYVVLKVGYPPTSVFIVNIALTISAAFARVIMLKRIFIFSLMYFLRVSLARIVLVLAISGSIVYFINNLIEKHLNIFFFFLFFITCVSIVTVVIWLFGLVRHERKRITEMIKFLITN